MAGAISAIHQRLKAELAALLLRTVCGDLIVYRIVAGRPSLDPLTNCRRIQHLRLGVAPAHAAELHVSIFP